MAKKNIIDLVLKTISDVQKQNRKDPNVQTADATVFDLLKDKLRDLDNKTRDKRAAKGKSPESILDLIKREIEGAKSQNKKDSNVQTAPKSVFKDILRKVEERPQKQANKGIARIINEYNLDVRKVPQKVLLKIQKQYIKDQKKFDEQYAQAIYDYARKYS